MTHDDLLAISSDQEIASHYRIAVMQSVMHWPIETDPWIHATEESAR